MKNNSMNFLSFFLFLLLVSFVSAQLRTDFYKTTCPNVESLVRAAVQKRFKQAFPAAPATLRLFFHDCFVRGCDASILIASPSERDHPDDVTLAADGFDTVVKAKQAVDSDPNCRNKVSCADILALAARDAVVVTGPSYPVELGRRDGRSSTVASVQHNLPQPGFNLDSLNTMFARHGLSQSDMIALSGAHTLGVSHCGKFSERIYNFTPGNPIDPTLNRQYAMKLRKTCPINGNVSATAVMDKESPLIFNNDYFKNLQRGMGLLTSDQVLFTDNRSRPTVDRFASSEAAFRRAFVSAMTKLGRVGVKTGMDGEIRRDCTRIN